MFECPHCGWGLSGGDELGVQIEMPEELNEKLNYCVPPPEDRFKFCYHCGKSIDSIEDIMRDIEFYSKSGNNAEIIECIERYKLLIKRGA